VLENIFLNLRYFLRELRRRKKNLGYALRNNKITIPRGKHTYGPDPILLGPPPVVAKLSQGSRIGSFCSIAPGLRFLFRGKHMTHWVSAYPFYDRWGADAPENCLPPTAPIIIGNDVWVATNVSIMQGVRVGDGAVIAQESLVTKDVPPYAIVGGNPAKIIRYRFSEEQICELLKIAWWNWNDATIREFVPLLLCSGIDEFIYAAREIMCSDTDVYESA